MNVPFFKEIINSTQKKLIAEVLEAEIGDEKKVTVLEEAFIDLTGASYAVATNNATSAMHLSLCAIDIKRGDKVLCSVNAFPSMPEVVRHFDAEPVFIDINGDDFNIDLDKLETYLESNNSKKLKAVIVSHVAGQTTDLNKLYDIARAYDVKVIEDASEALGAKYEGKEIGATGADVTIFSFNPHMHDNAGHGGVIVLEDESLYDRARLLRNHAIPESEDITSDELDYIYDVVDIGCQYTLSELDAAYCLGALENIQSAEKRRKEIASIYSEKLQNINHITVPTISEDHFCSNYIIKVDKNRDSFARDLKDKGICTGLHYIPLHLLSYYKSKYELRVNSYPVVLQSYQQILSLPIYEAMSDSEVNFVCDTIKDLAKDRV